MSSTPMGTHRLQSSWLQIVRMLVPAGESQLPLPPPTGSEKQSKQPRTYLRYAALVAVCTLAWLIASPTQAQPVVSLTATPDIVSEEDNEAAFTLTFRVDGEVLPPVFDENGNLTSGGLSILFDAGDFDALLAESHPDLTTEGLIVGRVSDLDIRMRELLLLSDTATMTFHILNDVEQESDQTYTFGILPNTSGALPSTYLVNSEAAEASFTLIDGQGGPGAGPRVSLSSDQTHLSEGDSLTLQFRADGALPATGLRVMIGSPRAGALQELTLFDTESNPVASLSGISDYEQVGVFGYQRLVVTMTEPEASIRLPVVDDGLYEGPEFFRFGLVDGELYEVAPEANAGVTLHDQGEAPVKPTLNPELIATLDAALDANRPPDVPGAAAAIIGPGGDWFGASGVSDIANQTPLQTDDRFEAGSITKTFVATAILHMVEEGLLSLEDTLTDWLPVSTTALIPHAEVITIRQLLRHTSGIADYLDVLTDGVRANPTVFFQQWQLAELIRFIEGVPSSFEPGTSWHYSNTNYILAGLVIEAVTGNSYAQEIRRRILTPLNLQDTFTAEVEDIPGGYIDGYLDFDDNGTLEPVTRVTNLSWAGSAGSLISTLADLGIFFNALFKGKLLRPESVALMLATIPVNSANYDAYGMGIGTLESRRRFWYAHRGQTLAFRGNLWYSPLEDIIYVELLNGRSRDNLVRDLVPAYRNGLNPG